jgi:hypothetical protein
MHTHTEDISYTHGCTHAHIDVETHRHTHMHINVHTCRPSGTQVHIAHRYAHKHTHIHRHTGEDIERTSGHTDMLTHAQVSSGRLRAGRLLACRTPVVHKPRFSA